MKAVRVVLLLLVVVMIAVGGYLLYQRTKPGPSGVPGEIRASDAGAGGVRVEEKYGVTTETVNP